MILDHCFSMGREGEGKKEKDKKERKNEEKIKLMKSQIRIINEGKNFDQHFK